ncbi:MAG: hypothetical protein JWQ21_3437 [Herminiimonas sp.]|jgi:hypothetical protein|nr:hypothetical protein [Herminiimonas sp.]
MLEALSRLKHNRRNYPHTIQPIEEPNEYQQIPSWCIA